jgi:uncharacterized cupin superfamily protein
VHGAAPAYRHFLHHFIRHFIHHFIFEEIMPDNMHPPRLQKFAPALGAGEEYYLVPEKLIAGNPQQTVWQQYTDASGKFCAGQWQSEGGKWHVSYTEEEYCQLLQGISIVTDTTGHAVTLVAGDSFVIPAGFVGTWEVVETTRKIYVIYQA